MQGEYFFGRNDEVVRPERIEARALVIDHFLTLYLEGLALPGRIGDAAAEKQFPQDERTERVQQLHAVENPPGHVAADLLVFPVIAWAYGLRNDLRVVAEKRVHLLRPFGKHVPLAVGNGKVRSVFFAHRRHGNHLTPAAVILAPSLNAAVVIAQSVAVVLLNAVRDAIDFGRGPAKLVIWLFLFH